MLQDSGVLSGEEVVVDDVLTGLLKDIRPAEQHHASKHRHGRRPKMTGNQRRLFGKWTRATRRLRMQHAMDATALRRAMESGD